VRAAMCAGQGASSEQAQTSQTSTQASASSGPVNAALRGPLSTLIKRAYPALWLDTLLRLQTSGEINMMHAHKQKCAHAQLTAVAKRTRTRSSDCLGSTHAAATASAHVALIDFSVDCFFCGALNFPLCSLSPSPSTCPSRLDFVFC